jgi:hypothetical protein
VNRARAIRGSRSSFRGTIPATHALPSVPMNEIDLAGRIDPVEEMMS